MSGLRSAWASRTRVIVGLVTCSLAIGVVAGTASPASAANADDTESKAAIASTGALTAAAMENPKCDPATGRFRFQYYAAPPCVKVWKPGSDNGGATAQGVTKDSIKVVVLWNELPPDQYRDGRRLHEPGHG